MAMYISKLSAIFSIWTTKWKHMHLHEARQTAGFQSLFEFIFGFSRKPDLCGEMEVQVMTFYLAAMGLQHGGQSPQLDR